MREDIKELINKDKDFDIETIDTELASPATDFFNNMVKDIDEFDKVAWSNKAGFDSPHFPSFTKGLEGWCPGFYAWAGPANAGKTAVMLNVMEDLCMTEKNKLFGIYFSLDDSKNRVIPRIVAMRETIPINVVYKPVRYQNFINNNDANAPLYNEWLIKRKQGLENLKTDANKMLIFDSQEIKTVSDMYDKIQQIHAYVKAIDPEMNIIIGIDSIKDVILEKEYMKLSVNERIDEASRRIKDWSIEFNCIIFGSMHLRKLNGNRRPSIDDLKDSNTLEYELDACFLVYNDVSKNKQSAKIFRREASDDMEKYPVIEIDWAKNKISSYKGITFCNFSPEYSKCEEVAEEVAKDYSSRLNEV